MGMIDQLGASGIKLFDFKQRWTKALNQAVNVIVVGMIEIGHRMWQSLPDKLIDLSQIRHVNFVTIGQIVAPIHHNARVDIHVVKLGVNEIIAPTTSLSLWLI